MIKSARSNLYYTYRQKGIILNRIFLVHINVMTVTTALRIYLRKLFVGLVIGCISRPEGTLKIWRERWRRHELKFSGKWFFSALDGIYLHTFRSSTVVPVVYSNSNPPNMCVVVSSCCPPNLHSIPVYLFVCILWTLVFLYVRPLRM